MPTIEKVWPDGTRGRYTLQPGSPAMLALAAIKPLKRPKWARTEKRLFPSYAPGITSTADYINAYFGLNSSAKIAAYPRHETDWLSLYAPLPDEPAAVYQGLDSVETISEGEE